ncbi:hypothetical protein [Rhizobium leucaenae]|uniref:hypothetical protein n=1 Tax=Rhizobium leucaenae TaxID=29450 RepID=UPI0031BABDEF
MRKQGAQNPGFRKDVGVFLVGGEPKDRSQVAAQHDRQFGVIGHKRHLIDQRAEHLSRLGLAVLALQALVKRRDPLPKDLRHVRMQKGRRLLSICQQLGQFGLAGFKATNLVLELSAGHSIQDRLDRSIQVPLDAFQFLALTDDICATLNPQPVHLASEFVAELLEELGLHQMGPQAAQY